MATQPQIFPEIVIHLMDDKKIAEIQVQEFPVKPVSYKGRYYKRVGASNHLMDIAEAADIYLRSIQSSWDAYPYSGGEIADLNLQKVKVFIAKVNESGRFYLDGAPLDSLEKLRLIRDGKPTNAAMILFSKKDLRHNVHIGRFKSPSHIIDDRMISGNL